MWPFKTCITVPDENTIENGAKYCFVIDVENRGRTGKIWNDRGDLLWRYAPRLHRLRYSLRNPFKKPDFVVVDKNERTTVAIRRTSFVPSRYHVLSDELVVGQIAMKSPLLNKYSIDVDGLTTCVFRMPLFTVYFHGQSNSNTRIWAVVGPSKMQWNILVQPELDDVKLLASLAFIHNQWYNYS